MITGFIKCGAAAALFLGICAVSFAQGEIIATSLKVNALDTPLAVENKNPRLSWTVEAPDGSRNTVQSAFQIQAATSEELLKGNSPDLWDSGKVESQKQIANYEGKIPQTGKPVFWRVRLWGKEGGAEAWSDVSKFEFGMLEQDDWTGPWIGMKEEERGRSAPYFKTKIRLKKDLAQARAYVCGLGWFQLYVNGKQIGDHSFDPPQTDYDLRCMYVPFDISPQMKKNAGDENDMLVLVGDGWYNQDLGFGTDARAYGKPSLRAQFVLTYADGTRESIPADLSWKTRKSPIVSSNIYAGERYDANLEPSAAEMLGDEGWRAVEEKPAPGGVMTPMNLQPERTVREVKPLSVKKKGGADNVWVYDFGQNVVGRPRIKIEARPGTIIRMTFGEKMLSNGEVDYITGFEEFTRFRQTDIYEAKGEGVEIWEPKFTYHGFQYVELFVEGEPLKTEPSLDTITALVTHTDMPVTGEFESSDENLNRLHAVAAHTYLMGSHSFPMDCPIRERCGFTGDAHTTARMALMNFDAAAFLRKYTEDVETGGRNPSGEWRYITFLDRVYEQKPANIPHLIAPGKRREGQASPDWGAAVAFIPWELYCATGDESVLLQFYPLIQSWIDYLLNIRDDNGLLHTGLGDWCAPMQSLDYDNWQKAVKREVPVQSTAMFIHTLDIASKIAGIAGDAEKSKEYANMAKDISSKLLKTHFRREEMADKNQTMLGLTLVYTKDKKRDNELLKALLERSQYGGHFETGVFGTPAVLKVLNRFGRQDVAYKLLTKPEYPSYRAMLDMGATSLWETWPINYDKLFGSMSHPFHGGYDEWIFSTAGIEGRDDGGATWNFTFYPLDGLTWAKASIRPPAGKISSGWKRDGGKVTWTVEIPANQRGFINIPAKLENIKESGKNISGERPDWLHGVKTFKKGDMVYRRLAVGSGKYTFEFALGG